MILNSDLILVRHTAYVSWRKVINQSWGLSAHTHSLVCNPESLRSLGLFLIIIITHYIELNPEVYSAESHL
jgi:hypothetical protein